MNDSIIKFLIAWLLFAGSVVGQSSTPGGRRSPDGVEQSDQVRALVQRLKLAKSQASVLGRKHPQYDAVQRQLAELERELELLRDPDSEAMRNAPVDRSSGRTASEVSASGNQDTKTPVGESRLKTVGNKVSARLITKPMLAPWHLKPIGGWKFPSEGAGGKGLGFSRGGMYVEHGSGKDRLLYVYGHQQAKECHLLKVSLAEMGSDTSRRLDWPSAVPVRLLKGTHTISHNSPYNLCRPHADGPLLTTGRVFYATQAEHFVGPWMNWFDEADGTTLPLAVDRSVDRRPTFGGGFCTIPAWFADEYLDGRDFGVGFGGYESGQGSSPGPSLFVADRPANNAAKLDRCLELLSFRWGGGKAEREERPDDYKKPLWGPPTEGGIGWWQADTVAAGPVWIDTPDVTGLCYWSVQGLGDLDYRLQSTTFSREIRVRLYVYDPNQLANVARGELRPHQVRGSYFEWDLPFDDGPNAVRWPIGAYWDAKDQLLYVSYQNSGGGQYEIPPVVVVYRVETQ